MCAIDLHQHRWVPGTARGAPTLLLLHGTGGNEDDLLPLARMVAPESAILSPRGNVLEHGAPRFFRRLAEGVFDLEDLAARTGELGDFVVAAAERYGFDGARVYALGFSNGANIAASLMLSRPDLLAGAMLVRAMVPFVPSMPVDLGGRPVLISAGRLDPLIPAAHTERLDLLLRDAGAEVTLRWQQASHQLVQGDVAAITEWLAQRG